jgi:acetyl-CoA carboxylase biotin carboxyl carrier protein
MNEKLLFSLIERFEEGPFTELEYHSGDQKLTLKKGGAASVASAAPLPTAVPQTAPESPKKTAPPDVITSPIVATFYASNMPDAPPFVQTGDHVKKGQTLCILEAMKMMNKLDAEADCEILAVKAHPGDLVEFGQVLFEIKKL